jgi:ATP-dependent helicase/nuclease subunit B
MRATFGLPSPDRRIGLAAHDFAQAFSASQVLLTRAERVDGTPTVPARWLLRLDNRMKAAGSGFAAMDDGDNWLGWQTALDRPEHIVPMAEPEPRPPVAARPRKLSVTQIETWMRDPYAIYARHVLRLRALDPIDADPGAAERGTIVHQVIDGYLRAHPGRLPDDALGALLEFGAAGFEKIRAQPTLFAFWWPRFERVAAWFVAEERRYREAVSRISSEVKGELVLDAFTLTATADRVDVLKDGSLSVIDYKTGLVPSKAEVALGFAPQLPLEAAIAEAGGFTGVAAGPVAALVFWQLSGSDPAGRIIDAGDDISALADQARAGLAALVARFDDPATPYLAQPDGARAPRISDYTHLARIEEWSEFSGGGDGP